jgi:hypothetical protein
MIVLMGRTLGEADSRVKPAAAAAIASGEARSGQILRSQPVRDETFAAAADGFENRNH